MRRIMRKVANNYVWSHYSMCDQKGKKKLAGTCVFEFIKSNVSLKNVQKSQFEQRSFGDGNIRDNYGIDLELKAYNFS